MVIDFNKKEKNILLHLEQERFRLSNKRRIGMLELRSREGRPRLACDPRIPRYPLIQLYLIVFLISDSGLCLVKCKDGENQNSNYGKPPTLPPIIY